MIQIDTIGATDLHVRYPRQSDAQDCYVEIDTRGEGRLSASANGEIGNAIPFAVYHGLVLRFSIPALRGEAANVLLAEIAPLAERVVAGASEEWDGSNHVGRLDADATEASEEIERLCEMAGGENEEIVVWDASEYYDAIGRGRGDNRLRSVAREIGITARTSDTRLTEIEREEERKASVDGADESEGLSSYLEELRAACRRVATERAQERVAS